MIQQPRSRLLLAWMALLLPAAAPAWAQNGLVGEYYTNNQFNGLPTATVANDDITIHYAAGNNNQIAPIAPTTDNFSIRWRGMINIPADGSWTFFINPDDYGRLWINNQRVVAQHSANAELSGTLTLTAGLHPIVLEYVEFGGNQRFLFQWQGPAVAKANVPLANLSSPAAPVLPAAPTINAGNGGLVPVNNVTLSTVTAGTALYYTLDGSDPGVCTPTASAVLYTAPFTVNQHAQLRARAYAIPLNGLASQMTTSSAYTPSFAPVAPPGTTQAGLYYRYFHTTTATIELADFDATQPPAPPQMRGVVTTVSATITPTRDRNDTFALIETGYLNVAVAGMWTFFTSSDEGSQLYIHGKLVVQNDGMRGATVERSGQIFLQTGLHPIEIRYFDRTGGEALTASWQGPAGNNPAKQTIPAANLSTDTLVATPTFTPSSPATFLGSQVVTLNCATPGAVIYYTTDGTAPDPRRATGSGPDGVQVTLTQTATLRAMAFLSPMNPSAVTSYAVAAGAVYTRTDTLPASVIASGVSTEVVVTFDRPVTAATAGTAANYTIDNGVGVSAATVLPKTGALVAHWRLDAASAVDSTGLNAAGTVTNAALDTVNFAPAPAGNAASYAFNGTNALVSFADADSLEVGAGSFTVTAWIRPANVTGIKRIAGKWDPLGDAGNGVGWFLNVSGDDLRFRVRSVGQNHDQTPNLTLVANVWTFIAARYDRQLRRMQLFVNGVSVLSNDGSTTLDDLSNGASLDIGAQSGAPATEFFNGNIDDVRIWRVPLSNSEIQALFGGADAFSGGVRLTTTALLPATTYTLSIQNVTDLSGNAVAAPATRTFRYHPAGSVWMDKFDGPGGTSIADLTRAAIFPNQPTAGGSLASFRNPPTAPDASNFGVRIRGYFIPGTTGNWRLGISSDDMGQLWLSTNEDPANKVLVSRVLSFTGLDQFNHANARQSVPIPLVMGQKYYMEALMKEGGGANDHVAVAAKIEDGTPIANLTAALTGGVISPFAPTPLILQQPTGLTTFPGASVTLTVAAEGAAPITYQWRKGGVNIVGQTARTLVLNNVVVGDTGAYDVVVTDGNTSVASAIATVSVVAPTPTLSSLSVVLGPVSGGGTVTLTGTNFFTGTTTVSFGGVPATGVAVRVGTHGLLTCVVPPHAEGTVDVVVVNPGAAGSATLANSYTYWAAPTIGSIANGTFGPYGPLAGGNTVTITGTNFVSGSTSVTFDGLPATSIVVTGTTSLTCLAPAHGAEAINVVVTAPGGAVTATDGYEYVAAPTAASITPVNGPIIGGQAFSLTGTNLIPGYTTVNFAANAATAVNVDGGRLSLTGTTPAGATTVTVAVTVVAPGGTSTAVPGGYTYYAAPTITSLSVTDGPDAGGTALSITGTNFVFIAGQTSVTFGVANATFTVISSTQIDVTTPAGSGPANVVVNMAGGTATLTNGYTYHPPPTLTAIDIGAGPTIGGTAVVLTGTNFRSGLTTVTFGGTAGTVGAPGGGNTTLPVTTPSHAPGTFDVVVTTPGGSATLGAAFTYSGPFITSVTNSSGPAIGGDAVVIAGVGFTGVTNVIFGGTAATFTVISPTQINVTTPAHAAGPVLVVVQTGTGDDDLPNGYTYFNPPTLTSVTPNQGPSIGGQTVTLTGTNFAPGFTTVSFGGTAATGVTVGGGGTSLTCVTPAHLAGLVSVDVATFTTQVATLSNSYTFIDPPTVSSILPSRGPQAGGQTVTITGANFVPGQTTVLFGAGSATAVTVAPGGGSLTCMTPAGAGTVTVQVTTFGLQTVTIPNSYTYVNPATLADLGITLTADNPSPALGDPVVLTAMITNTGAVGGTGIVVRELLPAGITFVAASPTQGTYDSATGLWSVGSVGPAGTATLLLSVLINTTSAVTVTAEVTACTPDDVDSTVNNSVAGEDDQASVTFQTAFQINSPATLPSATSGAFYWQPLQIQGGAPPYAWTLVSGTLPFNLDPVTGIISGTAPASGVYSFTLSVSDSDGPPSSLTQAFSITVNAPNGAAPTVNALPDPPDGRVGSVYDFTFTAVDGAQPYTWTVSAGGLPGGLVLNSRTGRFAGTPTASGTFNFTIQAASSTGNGTRAFSVTIGPAALAFRTLALPNGAVGQFYTQQVELEGGLGPLFTWSVSAGSLPGGLTLSGNTRSATVSGSPAGSGISTFTLQAIDGGPSGATVTRSFSITASPAAGLAFEVTTASLPGGTQGRPYTAQLSSRGGTGFVSWSLASGQLPAGLSIGVTGQISGTPSAAGRYEIVVQGSAGSSDTQALTLDVAPAPQITTAAALPTAIQGEPYAVAFEASGGQAPFAWTSTALPAGLALNLYSGMISGTPGGAGGTFDVTVTDANGATDTVTFTLTVLNPAGIVLFVSLPDAQVGVPYSTTLTALGGTAPYAYSVSAGTLPAGLSLDPVTGVLSGTPTLAGAVVLTFQATGGGTATAGPITLTVNAAALSITPLSAPGADPGVPFTMTLTALNASGAATWQVVEGSLPAGLSLDSATGIISGTPFSSSTSFFRVSATDAAGNSAERRYTMGVAPGAGTPAAGAAGSGNGSESGSSCSVGSAGAEGVPWTLLALAAMIAAAAWVAGRRVEGKQT